LSLNATINKNEQGRCHAMKSATAIAQHALPLKMKSEQPWSQKYLWHFCLLTLLYSVHAVGSFAVLRSLNYLLILTI